MKQPTGTLQRIKLPKRYWIYMLMVLAVSVFLFYAQKLIISGGRPLTKTANTGLDTQLPDAHFIKSGDRNKMEAYELAGRDSAKRKEAMYQDPFLGDLKEETTKGGEETLPALIQKNSMGVKLGLLRTASDPQYPADKILEKLSLLKSVLQRSNQTDPREENTQKNRTHVAIPPPVSTMVLEGPSPAPDPEIREIGTVLEKLMVVQHPEIMQDSLNQLARKNKPEAYGWNLEDSAEDQGFHGLTDSGAAAPSNCIPATIEEDQTLVSGAMVKLRLLQGFYVHGYRIPEGQWVYGVANLQHDRLEIEITSLRSEENILPVLLTVYDMDGVKGIYIPGSIAREVSKSSASDAINTLGLSSLDPSVGAQAATAGIVAAKSLITKKVRLTRVTLKSGYQILLKDEHLLKNK